MREIACFASASCGPMSLCFVITCSTLFMGCFLECYYRAIALKQILCIVHVSSLYHTYANARILMHRPPFTAVNILPKYAQTHTYIRTVSFSLSQHFIAHCAGGAFSTLLFTTPPPGGYSKGLSLSRPRYTHIHTTLCYQETESGIESIYCMHYIFQIVCVGNTVTNETTL